MLNQFDYFSPKKLRFQAEEVSFGSSYDLVGKNINHPALEYGYVYLSDGSESNRFNYINSHTKYLTIHPYGCIYDDAYCGQIFKLKPNAGYTVNIKNTDTGVSYAVTSSNPFELAMDNDGYQHLQFLSITKESASEEQEPESDETDDGEEVTISTQKIGYQKPEDEEVEADNKGLIGAALVGIVMVVAVIWSFTTE